MASNPRQIRPVLQSLLAAAMFGVSTPLAKILQDRIDPVPLAGLLYLGSGIVLVLLLGIQRIFGIAQRAEAPITRADAPWITASILLGGIAAPISYMLGLRTTPAATASLLFNFESVATTVIGVIIFREAVGRRIWWAVGCITAASIVLSYNASGDWGISIGALAILFTCALWGLDNNITRNISAKNPIASVTIKGIIAGSLTLIIGYLLGSRIPDLGAALMAIAVGGMSYGISLVLFILGMRGLGAVRAGALFGTAPFVGAAISFILLRYSPDAQFLISLPLMLCGAVLLVSEQHEHQHIHEPMEHDHRHRHDDGHHNHSHTEPVEPDTAHSHPHTHPQTEHSHPHAPDIHHRHGHNI